MNKTGLRAPLLLIAGSVAATGPASSSSGTIAQPERALSQGGSFLQQGGFWPRNALDTIFSDSFEGDAPDPPDLTLLDVAENPPGTNDTLSGQAGAVGPLADVEVFSDAGLSSLVGQTTADGLGSFGPLSLGDNVSGEFWVVAVVGVQSSPPTVIQNDVQAPALPANLVVSENPPGADDQVSGGAGAAEPSALVEVYGDAGLTDLIGSILAGGDGSFGPVAIGDNAYDTVWTRAIDAAGNAGPPLDAANDIDGPTLTIVRLGPNPARAGVQVTFDVATSEPLPGPPIATVGGLPASYDGFDGLDRYAFSYNVTGGEPEGDVTVEANGEDAAANPGNHTDALRLDFQPPADPIDTDFPVTMNPPGNDDFVEGLPGAVEGLGAAQLSWDFSCSCATGCDCEFGCNVACTTAVVPADADGSFSPFSVGDNNLFLVHSVDLAGNRSIGFAVPFNDTVPPVVTIDSTPPPSTNEQSPTFEFTVTDATLPVSSHCRVDAEAFVECTSPFQRTGLAAGDHQFEVYAIDGAGNVGFPLRFDWRIDRVFAPTLFHQGRRFEAPRPKGYLVDGAGLGRFFVGGDRVWHAYEQFSPFGGNTWSVETIDPSPPTEGPAAVYDGATFFVTYRRDDMVFCAIGGTSTWSIETVASADGINFEPDIALNPATGQPAVLFRDQDTVWVSERTGIDAWATPMAVTNSPGIKAAALDFAPVSGDLGVVYEGSGIKFAEYDGSWTSADVTTATCASCSGVSMTFLLDDRPMIVHHGFNQASEAHVRNGVAWSLSQVLEDSAPFRFAASVVRDNPTGDVWIATPGAFSTTVGLSRYDYGTESWEHKSDLTSSFGSAGASIQVRSGGTFATANFDVGFLHQDAGAEDLSLTGLVGGTLDNTLSLVRGGGPRHFGQGRNPSGDILLAWLDGETGQFNLSTYDGAWSNEVIASTLERGDAMIRATGTEIWVASQHESGSTFPRAVVDRRSAGGTWSEHVITGPSGETPENIALDLLEDGRPIVSFLTGECCWISRIWVTWWDAGSFVTPTEIGSVPEHFNAGYPRAAIIGDADPSNPGSLTLVGYGNWSAREFIAVDLDLAGENPLVPGCETCSSTTTGEAGSNISQMVIAGGIDGSGQPVFVTRDDNNQIVARRFDGSQWNPASDQPGELIAGGIQAPSVIAIDRSPTGWLRVAWSGGNDYTVAEESAVGWNLLSVGAPLPPYDRNVGLTTRPDDLSHLFWRQPATSSLWWEIQQDLVP